MLKLFQMSQWFRIQTIPTNYLFLHDCRSRVTVLASNGIEYMLPIISTDNTVSGLNFGQIFYNLQYNIIEQKILPFK